MKLSTFMVDFTPPPGIASGFGLSEKTVDSARDPLYLRGFVFEDAGTRFLIASLDYCVLMNRAHDLVRDGLAEAVGADADKTIVHCVHQHDAPAMNFEIERYIKRPIYDSAWWDELVAKGAAAAKESLRSAKEVVSVGHRETRLYGYASNRRIPGPNGVIQPRLSKCADPALKAAPAGEIDPMSRTTAFYDASGTLLASMSFYATHPQVANGRGVYSADAPGEAMRLLTERFPGALHAYFSGPFGDLAAGRYTSPTDLEGNLKAFGAKIADAVGSNLQAMIRCPVGAAEWSETRFPFPVRNLDRKQLEKDAADPNADRSWRACRACLLSAMDNPDAKEYPIRMLKMGDVRLIFLPGEPFVGYQLFLQSLRADEFIAVAANCGDNFLYIPFKKNYAETGGYELEWFCWVGEEFEERFKAAATSLLA